MLKKLFAFGLVIMMITSGIVLIIPDNVSSDETLDEYSGYDYYWDDEGGADNLASTDANWYQMFEGTKTDNVKPTEGSHVYINESASAVIWDLTIYIENLTISTGYSGTFIVSSHMSLGSLYVIAGVFSGGTTYYIDISGNCYLNPTTLTNGQTKLNFTGDGTTLYVKNNRFLESRYYGDATVIGAGYAMNLFVDNSTTLTIANNARLGYIAYTATSYCLIYGNLVSVGNGHFRYFYSSSSNQIIPVIYQPQCLITFESVSSGNYYLSQSGNIVGKAITISASTTNAYLTCWTNGYTITAYDGTFSANIRTTLYLNESKIYCGGSFLTSASTVYYGSSSIVCYGSNSVYSVTPAAGANLYNLTINNSARYTLGASFNITSWCALYGSLSLNGYILSAPANVYTSYLPTSVNEGDYYYADIHTNVSFTSSLVTNAAWLDDYLLTNYTKTLIGSPGPSDSGVYYVEYTVSNIISSQTFYWNITVYNSIYCYFNSTPETEMTVGEMYNYHPDIVCNGTYTFGINNNGALVVSNGTGNVTGSPIAGIYNIELYVIDSSGNIAYQNWTLTVLPLTSLWSNDDIVSFAFLVIVMGILTIFNFIGYIKNIFLIQALSIALMIFAIPLIWSGEGPAIAAMIISIVGNLGITISGFFKES